LSLNTIVSEISPKVVRLHHQGIPVLYVQLVRWRLFVLCRSFTT